MKVRMFPALNVEQQATVANGRTCSGTPGTAVDVPNFDARNLAANGWTRVALTGATSARPTANPNTSPPLLTSPLKGIRGGPRGFPARRWR